jgi:gluconolactonase
MQTGIIATGAVPQLITRQFSFTEGPAVDKYGNVLFTDQPNNKIWKYSVDGNLSLFMEHAGRSNGMYFDNDGNLIACADEKNQLWLISPAKEIEILVNDFNGYKLNGPNDTWVHPKGYIYFTDPYYQRNYWTRKTPEIEGQWVYLLSKDKTLTPVIKNLVKPNGIIGTSDGKHLFVSDINSNKTYKYSIKKDGSLSEGKLFVNMGSDGMTIDNKGNIYLTGDGVTVFNARGKQIKHIPVPEKWTANVTFCGREFNKLFITASEAIYTLDMQVTGVR